MRVDAIALETVGVHDDTAFDVPPAGAVVVTGPNGSGKSSYVEAVALALWGESLRGEPLWREGQAGRVSVAVQAGGHRLVVDRKRTKAGAKSLAFTIDGAAAVKYETPTKAQAALEDLVGTFDSWRRTCVLSSADSAHFSLATDAERKRLLERLLGIDRLDTAATAAMADLKAAESRLALANREVEVADREADAAVTRVEEIRAAQAAAVEAPATGATVDHRLALRVAQEELSDVQEQQRSNLELVANARAHAQEAKRRAANCATANCPTCAQPIPASLRDQLSSNMAVTQAEAAAEEAKASQQNVALAATARELSQEIERLRSAQAQAAAEASAAAKVASVRAALAQQLERAEAARVKAEAQHDAAQAQLAEVTAAHKVAKAVREVFGFKGVRAHLLDRALRRIEVVASRNLGVLRPGMRLYLTSTSEKKTGGTTDAISLRVAARSTEAPRPYASLSGGERRRVDVALLLALADVAGAVVGAEGSTLWLDEVFDALDADGAEAVGQLVGQLTAKRAAVVITHAEALVSALRPVKRVRLSEPAVAAVA